MLVSDTAWHWKGYGYGRRSDWLSQASCLAWVQLHLVVLSHPQFLQTMLNCSTVQPAPFSVAASSQQPAAARSSCVTLGSTASFRTFRSSFALVSFGPFGSSRTLTYGHVSPPGDLSDLGNVLRFGQLVVAIVFPAWSPQIHWSCLDLTFKQQFSWSNNSNGCNVNTGRQGSSCYFAILCQVLEVQTKEPSSKRKCWPQKKTLANSRISCRCCFKETKRIHNWLLSRSLVLAQIKEAQLAKALPHPRRQLNAFVFPARTGSVYLFFL